MTGDEDDSPGAPGPSSPAVAPLRPVLETRRLVIRAPTLADAAALATLADNPKIAQNLTRMPHPYTLADAEDYIADACPADGLKHLVYRKQGDDLPELVGAISLDFRRGPVPELGYWMGEASGTGAMPPRRRMRRSTSPSRCIATPASTSRAG
ncbi:GNAT family N-acetyltransferase [Methylobrevis pamukkalensis]|uniref:N-acetyltransferase domain-containing protein n=1 Tax=Methylobrevis pamukkalensis TaxID=1439726 RepID=A0A1E3H8C4_9HYPH|nr:GNAT family N-acetyltransferase [Methylobrevis pamukkalensis]ODN72582.1 hypothetical protein A6302_00074 [Methylobrevis pamukkalensis]